MVYRKRAKKITASQKGSSSSCERYKLFCNQCNKTFLIIIAMHHIDFQKLDINVFKLHVT